MPLSTVEQTRTIKVRPESPKAGVERTQRSGGWRLAGIVCLALLLCSLADHGLAHWVGVSHAAPWSRAVGNYRRIGPSSGPQVFCAGSSLMVSALSWPKVSESLGQGMETWTVAGSTPDVWEYFQKQKRNSNTTIIAVSIYDMNEMRLAPERASYVPLSLTLADLWSSKVAYDLKTRILAQYALSYLRIVFPTAGDADKVLVGLRSSAAALLGKKASLEQHDGVIVEQEGVLDVQDETRNVSDWDSGHVLRRLQLLRDENHGVHEFGNGPKSRAFRRLLRRAQQQGRVIVMVLPMSQYYIDHLLDKKTIAAFEKALAADLSVAPNATVVRLDEVPGISDNKNYFDLVHMNVHARQILTPVFLKEVNAATTSAKPQSAVLQSH